ncbi:MAG: ROK family protein [Terracidiphilus sp.]
MLALSLDMGGTHIGCALVRDREILSSAALDSESAASLASLLPLLAATLSRLLAEAGANAGACAGIAIGFPGIVDARTGRILSTLKKYEDAIELDLAGWSRAAFGVKLRMENDARMALLGEQYAGAAQDVRDAVMMTLGTGIGGAAMIQGKLLRGGHAQAGCLGGHLPVDFRGRACSCGNIGCAEAEAAGWSLPGILRETPGFAASSLATASKLDFHALFSAADEGDAVALEVRARCLAVWAANAVDLVHAYDPELVIMGGGVLRRAEIIVPYVQNYVSKHAWAAWGKPQVRAAVLGESAALLGAVPLLSEEH